jgi:hypothetical protein
LLIQKIIKIGPQPFLTQLLNNVPGVPVAAWRRITLFMERSQLNQHFKKTCEEMRLLPHDAACLFTDGVRLTIKADKP